MLDHDKPAAKHVDITPDDILDHLTSRQHLHPHSTIRQVLDQTTDRFGCCPDAIGRAVDWLKIDPTSVIGRLRRSELVQLSRAVHRFWMQNLAGSSSTAR